MSANIFNQVAYLRTTREFPEDLHQLTVEVNKTYVDIANAVNNRTISIFPTTKSVQSGENWFINSTIRQEGFRQVYIVPAGIVSGSTLNIGFKISTISQFTPKCYGTYRDAANSWYGLIFATSVPIAGQISFYIKVNAASTTSDQIIFEVDGAAPVLVTGTIVLEWISKGRLN